MQLAETKSEIRFGEIQQHMQISEAEVEEFLIDVLKTKLVRAKIDQGNQVWFNFEYLQAAQCLDRNLNDQKTRRYF